MDQLVVRASTRCDQRRPSCPAPKHPASSSRSATRSRICPRRSRGLQCLDRRLRRADDSEGIESVLLPEDVAFEAGAAVSAQLRHSLLCAGRAGPGATRGNAVRHRRRRRGWPRRRRPRPPSGPARRRRRRLRRQGRPGAALRASDVVNYRSEDLRGRIKAITSEKASISALDNIGGAIFEQMARLMKWDGRLMPIGFTSGEIPQIPMNLPLLKNYAIIGVFVGAWAEKFSARSRAHERHADAIAGRRKNPPAHRSRPPFGGGRRRHARRRQSNGSGTNCPQDQVECARTRKRGQNR